MTRLAAGCLFIFGAFLIVLAMFKTWSLDVLQKVDSFWFLVFGLTFVGVGVVLLWQALTELEQETPKDPW